MYQKQNTNNFIAFRSLFDRELLEAIDNNNINQITELLNTTYNIETENNYYESVPIDIQEISQNYHELVQEIENNPSLIYKL